MVNLLTIKTDVVKFLTNEKYLLEQEFVRLSNDETMKYSIKINSLMEIMKEIVIINGALQATDVYYPKQKQPQQQVINGQSHQE